MSSSLAEATRTDVAQAPFLAIRTSDFADFVTLGRYRWPVRYFLLPPGIGRGAVWLLIGTFAALLAFAALASVRASEGNAIISLEFFALLMLAVLFLMIVPFFLFTVDKAQLERLRQSGMAVEVRTRSGLSSALFVVYLLTSIVGVLGLG